MKLFTINMVNWNVSKKVKLGTPCVWIELTSFRCIMSHWEVLKTKSAQFDNIDIDPTRVQRLKKARSVKRPIEITSKKVILYTKGSAKALENEFRNHGFALTCTCPHMFLMWLMFVIISEAFWLLQRYDKAIRIRVRDLIRPCAW